MEKKAVVFGGSGMLGGYIVKQLAQAGYMVIVVCRDVDRVRRLSMLGPTGRVVAKSVNLASVKDISKLLEDVDVVVNAVGILFERGKQKFKTLHADLPGKIAQAANRAKVKHLIHISALAVDKSKNAKYAKTKLAGEKAVLDTYPNAVILRPSVIFSPEDSFFNQFAKLASWFHVLPLIGGGTAKFQPVYAGDVAKAVLASIERKDQAKGQIYELGGPDVMTFKEVLDYILALIKVPCIYVPLPFWIAHIEALFFELLPTPPLTRDQLRLLKTDNVVAKDAKTLSDLGIKATSVQAIVPDYLN